MFEDKIKYLTPDETEKIAEDICNHFPISMNILAGNTEKAEEIQEKDNERG